MIWRDLSWSALLMGMLVAVVGFTSSFAIVLQGFRAAGATEAQATSGLMALSVGMGLSGIWLSARHRIPISVAWSTPGAALLIISGGSLSSFNAAVGAFVVCGLLLLLAGVVRPLGRAIGQIPSSLANAMLAGILLMLCLAPVRALAFDLWLAVPVILTWWLVGLVYRLFAVPMALIMLLIVVSWRLGLPDNFAEAASQALVPTPLFVMPVFEFSAIVSIGLPLFVVTMASQNIPGMAVLRANGYTPQAGPLISNTAIASVISALFGAHAINLAAITAAMCAGPDAHADPARRYWAAIIAGIGYVLFGLMAGVVVLLVTMVPSVLIEAIAGLALIGAFTTSAVAAFAVHDEREAAAVTFLFAASGVAFMGVGGAFWGLLAGGVMLLVSRRLTRRASQ